MEGWVKGLVAVTCVAVLAALGWWGWSERQRSAAEAAAQAAAERSARVQTMVEEEYREAQQLRECAADLREWQDGDRKVILDRYGDGTVARLRECRSVASSAE